MGAEGGDGRGEEAVGGGKGGADEGLVAEGDVEDCAAAGGVQPSSFVSSFSFLLFLFL